MPDPRAVQPDGSDSMSAVLVTSAGGFVRLALVEVLLARGEAVMALDVAKLPDAARPHFAALRAGCGRS